MMVTHDPKSRSMSEKHVGDTASPHLVSPSDGVKPLASRFNTKRYVTHASWNLPEPVAEQTPVAEKEVSPIAGSDEDNRSSESTLRPVEYESFPEVLVRLPEHTQTVPAPAPAPASASVLSDSNPYSPTPFMGYRNSGVHNVTPLEQLGDQADMIECPFCGRKCESRVRKRSSGWTHFWGVSCLALTLIGTTLPYIFEWSHHVEHVCSNCEQVVMRRKGTLLGSDGKVETYGAVREEKIDEAKRSAAIRYYTRDSSKKPWKISSQPSNQK